MFARVIAALAVFTLAPLEPLHREQEIPDKHQDNGFEKPGLSKGQCFSDVRCKDPTKTGSLTMLQCAKLGGNSFRSSSVGLCLPLSKNRDDFFVEGVEFVRGRVVVSGSFVLSTASEKSASSAAPLVPRRRWILPLPNERGMWNPNDPNSAYNRVKQAAEAAGYETISLDRL